MRKGCVMNKVTEPLLDHASILDHFVNVRMKYNNMLNNKDRQMF